MISVVVAVGLAGCTALPDTGSGDDEVETTYRITEDDGLTVSFQSVQRKYFEDGQLVFDFSAQNTGQSDAENVKARLFGASFLAGNDLQLSNTQLDGVDRAAQQPGGVATATYRQDNPVDLRQGDVNPYPAGVRVMYDYSTTASAAFRVVPRGDFSGQSELVTTTNTAAPVKADIEVQSPKPVSPSEGNSTVQLSIPVVVRNVAGGKVVQNINGERGRIDLTVSFPLASESTARITDCGGSGGGSTQLSIPRGRSQRQVFCTAEISEDVFDTQLSIEAELDYTYFETTETMFEIEGLDGDQTPGADGGS